MKCEEYTQELNEQSHVLPFSSTDKETNWTNDANETIQVKQEKKEYPDGYDGSSEMTRIIHATWHRLNLDDMTMF